LTALGRQGRRRPAEFERVIRRQDVRPLFRAFTEPGGYEQDAVEAVDRDRTGVASVFAVDLFDHAACSPSAFAVARPLQDHADLALADEVPEWSALFVWELVDERELAPRLLQPVQSFADAADEREFVPEGGGTLVLLAGGRGCHLPLQPRKEGV